jgi:hypothetical protein
MRRASRLARKAGRLEASFCVRFRSAANTSEADLSRRVGTRWSYALEGVTSTRSILTAVP